MKTLATGIMTLLLLCCPALLCAQSTDEAIAGRECGECGGQVLQCYFTRIILKSANARPDPNFLYRRYFWRWTDD